MKSVIIKWFLEQFIRLARKSPVYFRVWKFAGAGVSIICGIPDAIFYIDKWFKFDVWQHVPGCIHLLANDGVTIAATMALYMASQVVQDPRNMPFTPHPENK